MPCKIAEINVETENPPWQSVTFKATSGTSSSLLNTPRQNVSGLGNKGFVGGSDSNQNAGILTGHCNDLESQHTLQLDQAHRAGFDQGKQEARQEAATEMQVALDRLAGAIHEIAQVKNKIRDDAEKEIVKLSLAVARRILHRELTTDSQSLQGIVYAALQRLQNREVLKIRVFPPALAAVRSALERNGGLNAIEIVADGHLQPGGLLFETGAGDLDASVDTQLQEIERGFADRLQVA